MKIEPDEETKTQQREAQRMLGRCMLRLQQYERLLKAMLIEHEFSGPVAELVDIRAEREKTISRKTLGNLIGAFVGSYLVADGQEVPPKDSENATDTRASFAFRFTIGLSDEEFKQTEIDLRQLVDLRNMLVHQFIDHHDPWTREGCLQAQKVLTDAYNQVDLQYARLVEIAKVHDEVRRSLSEHMKAQEIRDRVIQGAGGEN